MVKNYRGNSIIHITITGSERNIFKYSEQYKAIVVSNTTTQHKYVLETLDRSATVAIAPLLSRPNSLLCDKNKGNS
jgi:hypothetical protein